MLALEQNKEVMLIFLFFLYNFFYVRVTKVRAFKFQWSQKLRLRKPPNINKAWQLI